MISYQIMGVLLNMHDACRTWHEAWIKDTICRCPMKCMKCVTTLTWWPWHDFRKNMSALGLACLVSQALFGQVNPRTKAVLWCRPWAIFFNSSLPEPMKLKQRVYMDYGFYDILWCIPPSWLAGETWSRSFTEFISFQSSTAIVIQHFLSTKFGN